MKKKPNSILSGQDTAKLDILTAQLCELKEKGGSTTETVKQINSIINKNKH